MKRPEINIKDAVISYGEFIKGFLVLVVAAGMVFFAGCGNKSEKPSGMPKAPVTASASQEQPKQVQAEPVQGAFAPEISAKEWINTDKPVTIQGLKGKVAVIEFWATWCGPCRRSIPHINEIYKKNKSKGLVIIGLTDEPRKAVERFTKEVPIDYIVGIESQAYREYRVQGIPQAFIVGKDGKIAWVGHPQSHEFEMKIEELLK